MDFYRVLELSENASETDIKKAYRRLALQYHPDKNKDPDAEKKFKDISYAYQILSDPDQRRKYDRERHLQAPSSSSPQYYNVSVNQPPYHDPTTYFSSSDFFFQDPMDIFAQFFGGKDPFAEFLDLMHTRPTNGMMNMSKFSTSVGSGGAISKSTSTTIVNGVKTTITTIQDKNGTQTIEDHGNGRRRVIVNGVETENTLLGADSKHGVNKASKNNTSLLPPPPQQQQPSSTLYSPQQSLTQSLPPAHNQQESPGHHDSLLRMFCCPCC